MLSVGNKYRISTTHQSCPKLAVANLQLSSGSSEDSDDLVQKLHEGPISQLFQDRTTVVITNSLYYYYK